MKTQSKKKPSALENEVIVAVTVLYVMICVAMLGIHYIHAGQETVTSSTSPSHSSFSTGGGSRNSTSDN